MYNSISPHHYSKCTPDVREQCSIVQSWLSMLMFHFPVWGWYLMCWSIIISMLHCIWPLNQACSRLSTQFLITLYLCFNSGCDGRVFQLMSGTLKSIQWLLWRACEGKLQLHKVAWWWGGWFLHREFPLEVMMPHDNDRYWINNNHYYTYTVVILSLFFWTWVAWVH